MQMQQLPPDQRVFAVASPPAYASGAQFKASQLYDDDEPTKDNAYLYRPNSRQSSY